MRCQNCSRELQKDFQYCPYCGTPTVPAFESRRTAAQIEPEEELPEAVELFPEPEASLQPDPQIDQELLQKEPAASMDRPNPPPAPAYYVFEPSKWEKSKEVSGLEGLQQIPDLEMMEETERRQQPNRPQQNIQDAQKTKGPGLILRLLLALLGIGIGVGGAGFFYWWLSGNSPLEPLGVSAQFVRWFF